MAIELPSIEIIFKQLASTLVKRSERGIAILIVADETAGKQIEIFRNERELFQEKTAYKEENYLRILDVLSFNPSKVYVVKKKVAQPIKEVLELISRTVKTGWITYVGEPADYVAITAFIKAQ
ncbi:MAG: phage tail protein, partial [Oscillospiraceae bacterium]